MRQRPTCWMAALLFVFLMGGLYSAQGMTIQFDQPVYFVNGPGEQITAQILIDADSVMPGIQPVPDGLFSAGVIMSFDNTKAIVAGAADVVIPPMMNFFGLSGPAFVSIAPAGQVAFHSNVNQLNNPLVFYHDSLLATVKLTNQATAIDSYPLNLDFSRDLGINEDFFVDGLGATIDPLITFIPSRVMVVPEPSSFPLMLMACACVLRRKIFYKKLPI